MDIVLANHFFHLFDWDKQVEVCKNVVALSRPGTWVVGYQIGSAVGMAIPLSTRAGGTAGAGDSTSRFFIIQIRGNSFGGRLQWRRIRPGWLRARYMSSRIGGWGTWIWRGRDRSRRGSSSLFERLMVQLAIIELSHVGGPHGGQCQSPWKGTMKEARAQLVSRCARYRVLRKD